MTTTLLPGSTIGIFGNGQLGRMIALAAKPLGYRVHVFGPEAGSPAAQVADAESVARYDDRGAVERFASSCDVITLEFENIPVSAVHWAEAITPVRPGSNVLEVTQHRVREKSLCVDLEVPVPSFAAIESFEELRQALRGVGVPAVLKTATLGYDGKGQARIATAHDAAKAWDAIGARAAILEAFVPFVSEISIVAARGLDGSFRHWGVIENVHTSHILDTSVAPASVSDQTADHAVEIARQILEHLGVVGVMCVEMFLCSDGAILVNELAPRVHNSGHLTIEASPTSQFEQQVRAVCGLPLGDSSIRPAAMANLLGDLWANGQPAWEKALGGDAVKLHLYGKSEARAGRKMGHLTALGATTDEALRRVVSARNMLRKA
ncbi:MAG: 5-(carboxyamino)imidazole ribonucleotide synthase [Acidobacteria bacterium]|nr:5-(carboxyamino)imidazole ribonucleotide synthase [Acidobacteriota bacterium]